MANIEKYRASLKTLLERYGQLTSANDEVETQIIIDTEHDHYQLVQVGWQNKRRIYGCILHLDIKGDKVWIQHNGTEIEIADELVALGIPQKNIVVGFHSPYKRQFTEFATA
jgi:hypothetical protein